VRSNQRYTALLESPSVAQVLFLSARTAYEHSMEAPQCALRLHFQVTTRKRQDRSCACLRLLELQKVEEGATSDKRTAFACAQDLTKRDVAMIMVVLADTAPSKDTQRKKRGFRQVVEVVLGLEPTVIC
jgi:hypothetical protein